MAIDQINLGSRNMNVVKFILSLLMAFLMTWFVKEPSFTEAQIRVLFLLVFSVALWLSEAVPPFSVGILIIAFLVYTQGYEKFTTTPEDITIYTNTFSSSVIWLMLGGFFLASAMTKTKLDIDLIIFTIRICGSNPKWILFGMMLITMVASMLISNTATTAMVIAALMPLLMKLGKQSSVSTALILGIPIAATTGGMGTMIGSPPNAVVAGALFAAGQPINFIEWIYFGLPLAAFLTLLAWWVLSRIFMKKTELLPGDFLIPDSGPQATGSSLKRWTVIIVLSITLLLWLTNPLHGLSAAAVSAIPLVLLPLTQIINGEDIRAMGWDTLLLVAGGLALGTALQHTGLLALYAERIAGLEMPDLFFYFILAYATMLFSNVMSNTATSTVLIPLGMAIFPDNQTEIAMIIGLSASTALFLPVSTPPNAIAYGTRLIEQKDFRIGGLLIGIIGPAIITLWVLLIS
jgi:sodium-dependent dicarboxylate transporter 2/3/5